MATQLVLGGLTIEVIRKDIKNIHLSVLPPMGAVRIAAPQRMRLDAIRLFAIAKLPWIRKHQRKLQAQERESPRDYVERESHYLWGRRYLLRIIETNEAPLIEVRHRSIVMQVRPGTTQDRRAELLHGWYRDQIRQVVPDFLEKWQPLLRVKANRVFVQRMKTKWGSANPVRRTIRLNSELAKKPQDCLEYVVLHELSHFLVPKHDKRFLNLLDGHMPNWRHIRHQLNTGQLPSLR